ncbi:hypothetical protein CC86DRAFT_403709 [Ophiobolus disseminans]|uniref:Uncharacterized protein n=1 Tax=Ophiobolus disseminans TaxID=1469910 RepID=A0A6A7A8J3_9PLEO|nr:hypothetical protein CC86DRAFT_403709 [Ophiobolus disseminans]
MTKIAADQQQAPSTPLPALVPRAPVVSDATQLPANTKVEAQATMAVAPTKGFDLVFCDLCDKDVAIRWELDDAGEQVHFIEAHDRAYHFECPDCHWLIGGGIIVTNGTWKTTRTFPAHDAVCHGQRDASRGVLFYCTHCGIAVKDRFWYREKHIISCKAAAMKSGTLDLYNNSTGRLQQTQRAVRALRDLRFAQHTAAEETVEAQLPLAVTTLTKARQDSAAGRDNVGAQLPITETTVLPPSTPRGPSTKTFPPQENTGPEIVFHCRHCDVAVRNRRWYDLEHVHTCSMRFSGRNALSSTRAADNFWKSNAGPSQSTSDNFWKSKTGSSPAKPKDVNHGQLTPEGPAAPSKSQHDTSSTPRRRPRSRSPNALQRAGPLSESSGPQRMPTERKMRRVTYYARPHPTDRRPLAYE